MTDHVARNSILPFFFGISVFLTACSGTTDMPAPATGAAQPGTPASASDQSPAGTGNSASTDGDSQVPAAGMNTGGALLAAEQQLIAAASTLSCTASNSEAFRDTMLAVIKAARSASRMCGNSSHEATGAVTWNPLLEQAALSHVQDMARFNFFSHEGSDGLSVSNRADGVGYNWRAIGENIAAGQLEIEEVHQGWIDSPGHCRNIMNPLFTEVGAACVPGADTDYGTYWAVVFGDEL